VKSSAIAQIATAQLTRATLPETSWFGELSAPQECSSILLLSSLPTLPKSCARLIAGDKTVALRLSQRSEDLLPAAS
jgi:hypothetical protein